MFETDFLLTSLVVVLAPGTGVLYTISTGLLGGSRLAFVAAALGCTAGIVPHLLASVLGLAALLHVSAVAFSTLKFAGVAYLFYLAWRMWRDTGSFSGESGERRRSFGQTALRGFLINILNPKLSIFFLAFLPQFIAPDAPSPLITMFGLALVFMAMTLGIFLLYGLFARALGRRLLSSAASALAVRRSFAAAFAALGVKLATVER